LIRKVKICLRLIVSVWAKSRRNSIDRGSLKSICGVIDEKTIRMVCPDKAGFITGENICIDGGMTKQMIYHNDFGWKLERMEE
jgi:hypothetical protein